MSDKPAKIIKKIHKEREREFVPPGDPTQKYQRQYRKVRMHWLWNLWYTKRKDVILLVALITTVVCIVGGYALYLLLSWLWKNLGGVLF